MPFVKRLTRPSSFERVREIIDLGTGVVSMAISTIQLPFYRPNSH